MMVVGRMLRLRRPGVRVTGGLLQRYSGSARRPFGKGGDSGASGRSGGWVADQRRFGLTLEKREQFQGHPSNASRQVWKRVHLPVRDRMPRKQVKPWYRREVAEAQPVMLCPV